MDQSIEVRCHALDITRVFSSFLKLLMNGVERAGQIAQGAVVAVGVYGRHDGKQVPPALAVDHDGGIVVGVGAVFVLRHPSGFRIRRAPIAERLAYERL